MTRLWEWLWEVSGGERLPSEWMGEYPVNAAHGPGISQWLSIVLKGKGRRKRDWHVYRNVCEVQENGITSGRPEEQRTLLERLGTKAGLAAAG